MENAFEDSGSGIRGGTGEEKKRGVRITDEIAVFPFLVFVISVLLVTLLFITRIPALSILTVVIAILVAFSVLLSGLTKRAVSRYLLFSYLVLIGGMTLFSIAFGVEPFFKGLLVNTALALPALGVGFLTLYMNRIVKAKTLVASLVLSTALILLSIALFFQMNLKIRPQLASIKRGHDKYLASLRQIHVSDSPNVLLILTDDLGYGDIQAYGNTTINTPSINSLAQNGTVMDNFYAASPVCTPSRFSLLTGRYAARGNLGEVLMPTVKSFRPFNYARHWNPLVLGKGVDGILPDEVTLAEALQSAGYKTGVFGKWHLGDYGGYLPNANGFDYFYGSYYSNDMVPYEFYRNEEKVIEHPADQTRITRNLTDEVIGFIAKNRNNRFFVYYATPWPHHPLHASGEFQGTSAAGTYGDCLQEFDAGLGEILQTLRDHNLFDNTLIIFTSDNGPWHQGSTGGLRGRKANTLEGGHKVPFIACYPPMLTPGTRVAAPAMNIDLFPTILTLCRLPLPEDRVIDGTDMLPVLKGGRRAASHEALYYSQGHSIRGIQSGGFKYFDKVRSENSSYFFSSYKDYLFDLKNDPAESYNVKDKYPEVAEDLRNKLLEFRKQLKENRRGIVEK